MTTRNVRLTTINAALLALLIASLAGVAWTQVGAQEDKSEGNAAISFMMSADGEHFDEMTEFVDIDDEFDEIAKLLGIDVDTLWAELDSGKSLAEIAEANGVDTQKVIDLKLAQEMKFIDELLASGDISAEEAAEWTADAKKYIAFDIQNSFVDPFSIAQKALGLDEETFWAELHSGKSIAKIAEANAVDPQTIIDAILASESAMLDKEVEAGLITAEEAAEIQKEIVEFVNDTINLPLDEMDIIFEDVFMDDWGEINAGFDEIAKLIGIDEEAFWAEMDRGKSIAEIAKANGVDPQTIIDAQLAEEIKFIDELLAEGAISAEEAAEWKADAEKYIVFDIETTFVDPFMIAQKALGLDEETFWNELEAGKSVAQLAEEKGIDPQTIIDQVVASENELLDKEITAGLLSAEEADQIRQEISDYISDSINMTLDELDAQFETEFEGEWIEGDMEGFDFDSDGFFIIEEVIGEGE